MAKYGVRLTIDTKKVARDRLYQGKKGIYLDATVFIDVDNKDQYDQNGMITQDVSKDEKASGIKGNIIGNCKVFWKEETNQRAQTHQDGIQDALDVLQPPVTLTAVPDTLDDDIPF